MTCLSELQKVISLASVSSSPSARQRYCIIHFSLVFILFCIKKLYGETLKYKKIYQDKMEGGEFVTTSSFASMSWLTRPPFFPVLFSFIVCLKFFHEAAILLLEKRKALWAMATIGHGEIKLTCVLTFAGP